MTGAVLFTVHDDPDSGRHLVAWDLGAGGGLVPSLPVFTSTPARFVPAATTLVEVPAAFAVAAYVDTAWARAAGLLEAVPAEVEEFGTEPTVVLAADEQIRVRS